MTPTLTKEKSSCLNTQRKTKSVFGTLEWASQNANIIDGCKHDCKYCYSKEMAIRFGRRRPDNWNKERIRLKALNGIVKKYDGKVMFPSSHDIYPGYLSESISYLVKLLEVGNDVLIVTKPHIVCIAEICNRFKVYKDNILFRFTIGSSNSDTLRFWEPGAAPYEERLRALQLAYSNGYQTSVSCEPMLDNNIESVISDVLKYVTDSIWIGKANFLLRRLKINGYNDLATLRKAKELVDGQSNHRVLELYSKYSANRKIKWKESIKQIVGIKTPLLCGLDV